MNNTMETMMNTHTSRLAKLEERLLPPSTRTVRLVVANDDGTQPPYPDDLGPEDMMVVLVGVHPAAELTP